ncbi:pentatricopeptide repeat-containing protein At3g14730 [Daucus carota subsp. sativus]|uniref:pentatricopeptide repeat-containing protein At3g14730 n=1 Tax=Daucus carota subsp. sativus TaxID=79200 RepID=UPI0007EF4B7B|nr:PREDICTED: pentatricopeptide repeat-containing protein At3g14730 [Daucus carota subsp. sativus]
MVKRPIFFRNLIIKTQPFNHFYSSSSQQSKSFLNLSKCVTLLQSFAHKNYLQKGQQLHAYMLITGLIFSPSLTTSLINMYSKCNKTAYALSVFNTSVHGHNVYNYNAIIAGLIDNKMATQAFQYFLEMRVIDYIVPDNFTFPCAIKACCDVIELKKIHGLLVKFGLELDLYVGSALVHCYLKFGFVESAEEVFEEMSVRDVVLWNAMIIGFSQIGQFDKVFEVFGRMKNQGVVPSRFTITGILPVVGMKEGIDNGRALHGFVVKMGYDSAVAVSNAFIDLYGKCKCVDDAVRIFETMHEKDIFSWNSVICVHEQRGDYYGTLRFLKRMVFAGMQPDLVTVTTALPACAHLAALRIGSAIHGFIVTNGLVKHKDSKALDNLHIDNAIMYMYAKCGSLSVARLIFDKMGNKDTASWNIMIMGYGMQGFGTKALDTFSRMCEAQMKPNDATFVGILSACSHGGLLSQGRMFLDHMQPIYGVVPTIEHYSCVIDMLGRAGQLEEAYKLLITMPVKGNPVVWRAFLAACRLHGNADLAGIAANIIYKFEPFHCGSYVLISNVYGAEGRYEDVSEIRHTMREHNLKKTPGCSWIELSNGVHVFVTGDRTHAEDYHIYAALKHLTSSLRDYKDVPGFEP